MEAFGWVMLQPLTQGLMWASCPPDVSSNMLQVPKCAAQTSTCPACALFHKRYTEHPWLYDLEGSDSSQIVDPIFAPYFVLSASISGLRAMFMSCCDVTITEGRAELAHTCDLRGARRVSENLFCLLHFCLVPCSERRNGFLLPYLFEASACTHGIPSANIRSQPSGSFRSFGSC